MLAKMVHLQIVKCTLNYFMAHIVAVTKSNPADQLNLANFPYGKSAELCALRTYKRIHRTFCFVLEVTTNTIYIYSNCVVLTYTVLIQKEKYLLQVFR